MFSHQKTTETASKGLIAATELRKAEVIERETVAVLEITGPQSLLVDALISHGITLARLFETERAEVALERAMIIAQRLGTLDKAGLAALTMIEELDGLSAEALITNYGRASTWLADFPTIELLQRVNDAARKVLVSLKGEIDLGEALEILLRKN
jgi:hypothetical protein